MTRLSLGLLRTSSALALPALLAGCPGDDTSAVDDTDASSSGDADTTDASMTEPDPTLTDPDSSTTDPSTTDSPMCGDGNVGGDEVCDGDDLGGEDCESQGFAGGGALACAADCTFDTSACVLSACGDGGIDEGEECDGLELIGQDCESEGFPGGVLACTADCTLDTSGCSPSVCGDGQLHGDEQCDGADLDDQTCTGLDFDDGDLACNDDCTLDTSGCFDYACGNATIEGREVCDGVDLDGETCASQGFTAGVLTCNDDCGGFDTSQCYTCGDGSIDPGEQCDGANLDGETCISQGLDGGVLSCTAQCTLDLAECVGCGNGDQDPGEECDGNDFAGATCVGLGFDGGPLTCTPSCTIAAESCFGLHTFCSAPTAAVGPGVATTTDVVAVAGLSGTIVDVDVSIALDHTAVGDLDIDVRKVDTDVSVSLADAQCGTDDDIDAVFDQQAASAPVCGGPPAFSGSVLPQGDLDVYVGGDGNGTWELSVADEVAGNGGTLGSWCVAITTGNSCDIPFSLPSYAPAVTFPDAALLEQTRMTIAFDGTSYWASSGGSSDGNRIATIDPVDGDVIEYFQPNLDLRSVFTKGDGIGPVFSRSFADPMIRVHDADGVPQDEVALVGGTLDGQAAVAWDEAQGLYIANAYGTVSRWDANGTHIDDLTLLGYGELGGEFGTAGRGIAYACGYYLTYASGTLSAWDMDGNRVSTATLDEAPAFGDAEYSYSYANGMFLVTQGQGSLWYGYDVP